MKKIISRREFIKISSLSAAALVLGSGTEKYLFNSGINSFSMYGFLPYDGNILKELIGIIKKKNDNISGSIVLSNDEPVKKFLENEIKKSHTFPLFFPASKLIFNIKSIDQKINSDIIISDQKKIIYNPVNDFSEELINFREKIYNKKAGFFFTSELKKNTLYPVKISDKKIAVIENEYGEYDRINLAENYDKISVAGLYGITELELKNQIIKVKKASCRHKICMNMRAFFPGDIIACVPNKLLIKIQTM